MSYDLIVIGGGSGGVRAGRMAAAMGAKVLLIEGKDMGGTCVNVGCVPKKLFSYGAHVHEELEDAKGYGYTVKGVEWNWTTMLENKNKEIARLNAIYERILTAAGVEILRGYAKIVDEHTVVVKGERYTSKHMLVCTGGRPFKPTIEGGEYMINSDEAFHLKEWPKRAIVVGGGYIAVEFAGIFKGTGVETTIVHRSGKVLRGFDDDVRDHLGEQMVNKGIDLKLNCEIDKIVKTESGLQAQLSNGQTLETDLILCATGRVPLTENLYEGDFKLEQNAKGAIVVDENYQTNYKNVFAIGDVIDRVNLTPVALAQGMVIAHRLYGNGREDMNYENIATAVFSSPNVATVGKTQAQAREEHAHVFVYKSTFTPMKLTMSPREEKTLMKLLVCGETDKVLGCHMVGPDSAEIMQGIAIAMNAGATKADFDRTIGIHPSAAEELVTMRTPFAEYSNVQVHEQS